MDEREAIERLKHGDVAGLDYLVRTHQDSAKRTAVRITRDQQMAEDVVQDAFLIVHDRIETFDESRPFGPWFRRCVTNLALKLVKRQDRQVSLADNDGDTEGRLVDPEPGPDERVELRERKEMVRNAMLELTREQRIAILLRYYGDLTDRESAEEFGRPAGTVKWWLHSARGRLRGLLDHLESDPERDE